MKPLSRVKYQGAPGIGAVLAVLLGLLWLGQATALCAASPNTNGNRFLLLLDTSLSMKPLETPQREATFDLIYSGLRGHMTNGDTYGVWLAGDRNDTSFPMESWKLKHAVELAAKAAVHLKDRGYKGAGGLNAALADVGRVVQNVGDLTVVLVSNGETPVKGTPFDDAINARFAELAPAMKQAGATLNTVLVAQDGEFVAWAVNSPDFLVEVPARPSRTGSKKFQAAQAEKAIAAAKAEAAAATPRATAAPIIITRESVAQEKRSYSAATTLQVEPTVAVATNASNTVATVASVPTTNGAALATTNVPALAAATKAVVTSAVVVATVSVPASNVALTAVAPKIITPAAAPLASPAPSVPPPDQSQIIWWAGAGAGAMLVLVLVVFLLVRSRRAQPSLISQSLLRQREG